MTPKELRRVRELMTLIAKAQAELDELLAPDWQDENRTYLPSERQLDVRLDKRGVRLTAANGLGG